MPLTVTPVISGLDLDSFVRLPWKLYADSPLWVPPILSQDRDLLSPACHPFWKTARRELFLARRGGRITGRIAAIVDEKHNAYAGERCGAFGFFECEDDAEAAHALLDAARGWLAAQGMTFMRGPLNPSTNYTCGLLVDGFEEPPTPMMPWNPPYYPKLLETWKLRKEQDLFAYRIAKNAVRLSPEMERRIALFKASGRFTCRMANKDDPAPDIRIMLDLYRESWAQNWAFSPLSPEEAEHHVHDLKDILDPEFFVLFFHGDRPAAGMVALPDLTPLLKRLDGRMGLMAPLHYLACKNALGRGYRIMLFGILPEYRLFGLPLLLLDYMLGQARKRPDLNWVEGSWVLEDNRAICDLIEDFSGRITKRYRIYRREIPPCAI